MESRARPGLREPVGREERAEPVQGRESRGRAVVVAGGLTGTRPAPRVVQVGPEEVVEVGLEGEAVLLEKVARAVKA